MSAAYILSFLVVLRVMRFVGSCLRLFLPCVWHRCVQFDLYLREKARFDSTQQGQGTCNCQTMALTFLFRFESRATASLAMIFLSAAKRQLLHMKTLLSDHSTCLAWIFLPSPQEAQ